MARRMRMRIPRSKMARKFRGYKKRKSRLTVSTVGKSTSPLPPRFIAKHKYCETVTTSALGQYNFNLNSVYDPNRAGTGHQPYGFDTFATIYNRYRVISCGWRIQLNQSTSAAYVCGAIPANDVITFGSIDEMKEDPRCKWILQAASAVTTLKGKSYIPSLMGRTKAQYLADDRFQSDVTTSPAELAILNLFTTSFNGAAVALPITVMLEYTVEWFDPKILPQS